VARAGSVRCRTVAGSNRVFGVKDGRLLPKAPLHLQGDDFTTPIRECIRQNFDNPRPYWVSADWLLVGEGAEFQLYRALELVESGRL